MRSGEAANQTVRRQSDSRYPGGRAVPQPSRNRRRNGASAPPPTARAQDAKVGSDLAIQCVVAYSATPDLQALLASSVGIHKLEFHRSPRTLLAALPSAAAAVIAAEDVGDERICGLITACRAHRSDLPVLIVTAWDAERTRGLVKVTGTAVVWIHEAREQLAPAVTSCVESSPRMRLADAIMRWEAAAPVLRAGLASALRSACPAGSVNTFATANGAEAADLEREWRRVVPRPVRLKAFLIFARALRAEELRTTGLSWKRVATRLSADMKTIRRAVRTYPSATATLRLSLARGFPVPDVLASVLGRIR